MVFDTLNVSKDGAVLFVEIAAPISSPRLRVAPKLKADSEPP